MGETSYRIHADERQLQQLWERLNSRFDSASSPLQIRHLQIAGLSIQLECRSPRLLHYADIQLACSLAKGSGKPNGLFRVWHDEIASCLPPGCPVERVLILKDQFPAIKAEKDSGRLQAFDREQNIGYFCLQ